MEKALELNPDYTAPYDILYSGIHTHTGQIRSQVAKLSHHNEVWSLLTGLELTAIIGRAANQGKLHLINAFMPTSTSIFMFQKQLLKIHH